MSTSATSTTTSPATSSSRSAPTRPDEVVKPTKRFIPEGVDLVHGEIDRVDAEAGQVLLADGTVLEYDQLVIATGTTPRPAETPGMDEGEWRKSIHEFYTHEGATALGEKLKTWEGGRLVVHIVDMPIKCPVAPARVHLPGRLVLPRERHP